MGLYKLYRLYQDESPQRIGDLLGYAKLREAEIAAAEFSAAGGVSAGTIEIIFESNPRPLPQLLVNKTTMADIQLLLFREPKPLPTFHADDNRFRKHCVDCGTLCLRRADDDFDELDRGRGAGPVTYSLSGHERLLGGLRCKRCIDKIKEFLEHDYYGSDK
jgi:hypothetical protein